MFWAELLNLVPLRHKKLRCFTFTPTPDFIWKRWFAEFYGAEAYPSTLQVRGGEYLEEVSDRQPFTVTFTMTGSIRALLFWKNTQTSGKHVKWTQIQTQSNPAVKVTELATTSFILLEARYLKCSFTKGILQTGRLKLFVIINLCGQFEAYNSNSWPDMSEHHLQFICFTSKCKNNHSLYPMQVTQGVWSTYWRSCKKKRERKYLDV